MAKHAEQAVEGGKTAEVIQGGSREAGTNDTNAGVVQTSGPTRTGVIGAHDIGASGKDDQGSDMPRSEGGPDRTHR